MQSWTFMCIACSPFFRQIIFWNLKAIKLLAQIPPLSLYLLNLSYFRCSFWRFMEYQLFAISVHWLEFSLWSRLLLLGERERKGHPNNVWHPFALFTGGVNSELLRKGGFVWIFCDIRFICIMSWDHPLLLFTGGGVTSELVSQLLIRPVCPVFCVLCPVQRHAPSSTGLLWSCSIVCKWLIHCL